ncbi:hypothetical protein N7481_010243 [Penicillium waksmanii]|uniref:uncharacterized protein n=1 Tax=Penicillium waksmanii TaxID=69791 RepID=UPI00254982ED|nr:uncharacterized protein N7481_010243 [Penicillium waksmanii]KAJ5976536.1 hypothetical protein N7481_010243 [Penicillium waksmanii]
MFSRVLIPLGAAVLTYAQSVTPIVDIGYAIHQASLLKSTNTYYNFSNIRFAAPPVGELRFQGPVDPPGNRSAGIQDGTYGPICPQIYPNWVSTGLSTTNDSSVEIHTSDDNESEDCLFLDVVVPEKIFESRNFGSGSPVMVWIYGGGYVAGDKLTGFNPVGLLDRSKQSVIYVAMNYRLGAFGFLAGPSLQTNGTANVGLLDQRFALQWVQKYIHLFGGDPNRVTVFGESAGGGSIMHQITAYGGRNGRSPFQQAISMSPGFYPLPGNYAPEVSLQQFLKAANVSTVQEARQLSSAALIQANSEVVSLAPYGSFIFGPSVDGDLIPAMPGKLLLQGSFDHKGLTFANPAIANDSAFAAAIKSWLPTASEAIVSYLATTLYPPIFDGSQDYTTMLSRVALAIGEMEIACNAGFLAQAFSGLGSRAYLFSVPPGRHGTDTPYAFYTSGPFPGVENGTLAMILQDYFTQFAVTGDPNIPGITPNFPLYGKESTVLNMNSTFISPLPDPAANPRCSWWQEALFV